MTEQELLIIARLKNEVSRPVKEIKADFATLSAELATQDKLTAGQARQLRGLGTEMRNAQRDTKRLAQEFSDLGGKLTRYLTLPVAAVFLYSVKQASDLNEQVQKTNVVFGQFATGVHDFAANSAQSLGLSQRAFEQTAGSIGALLSPLGIGQQQASEMSTTLTQLAGDLASFYNTSTEDALAALQSGLVGQVRPLRRYGVQLSEVRLQEYAWANGIALTGQQLTSQQKSLAAYGVILNDTKLAQGDFARTSGGMANQTRIAQAEFENAAASLGEKMIPQAIDLLHVVTGLVDGFTSLPDGVQNFILIGLGVGALLGPMLKIISAWVKLKEWIEASRVSQALFAREAAGGSLGGVAATAAVPAVAATAQAGYELNQDVNDQGAGAGFRQFATDRAKRFLIPTTTIGDTPVVGDLAKKAFGDVPVVNWLTGTDGKELHGQLNLQRDLAGMMKQTSAAAQDQAKSVDDLVDSYDALSKSVDDTAKSYDAVLGRFLDAEDAQAGLVANVQKLADDLMKPAMSPTDQSAKLAADARDITRSVEANVIAMQKAGKLPEGEQSFFGAQVAQLMALRDAYPEIRGQLDKYIAKLREAKEVGKTAFSGMTSFTPKGSGPGFGFGPFLPTGDTATPRGWDGASGSLADTLTIHQHLDAMVPGNRVVTSALRGTGSSDHAHGRAFDLVGTNLAAYATAVRKIGGFAEFHGRGPARHLHVVPRTGPPAKALAAAVTLGSGPKPSGDVPVSFGNVIVNSPIDLERAVARGVRTAKRDDEERH